MSDTSIPPSPFAPYTPPAPPAPPAADAVVFTGSRREFFYLIVKGAGLGLVTFGFYRFWLSTYIRRHLWSGTSVGGDAPEYTGTPIELLLGFLFAIAILVPVYLAYFLVGVLAETYYAFASFPLGVFLYLFAQFAIYRARRYRLTRTVWRGVRFWMRGSGWNYAFRSVLWLLLVIITLGGAAPWRVAALERYKMRHSYYGNLQGSFVGEGAELFKRGWILWLSLLGLFGLIVLMMANVFRPLFAQIGPGAGLGVLLTIMLIFLIAAICIYPIYKAIEWRWWLAGVRFDGVSFDSTLRKSELVGLYWKVIGWSFLIGVIFGTISNLVIRSVGAQGRDMATVITQEPWLLLPIGFMYIATALAIGVIMQLYLTRDLWQRVADTTVVHNLAAADDVVAQGDAANALGEGFADGLDVGGL